jgi:hypothetical protein
LIAARNKITHPLTFFQIDQKATADEKLRMDKINSHPLQSLTPDECREYYQAVLDLDHLFFGQYDHGVIYENELVREVKKENTEPQGSQSSTE